MGLDWSGSLLPWVLVVLFSAGAILAYWRGRADVVLGLLFMAGSYSAITVPIAGSNLRLEMVAVPILAGLLLVRDRTRLPRLVRALGIPIALAAVYVVANLVSSIWFSPAPGESVKIVVWLAISVTACFVAVALSWGRGTALNLGPWIVATAVIQVAVAAVAVLSQALFESTWGVMVSDVILGKAIGLSWEANILSINIAIALPFLIWVPAAWRLPPAARMALLAVLSVGLGLAYSRGGILAFAVGAGAVLVLSYLSRPAGTRDLRGQARSMAVPALLVLLVTLGTMEALDLAGEQLAEARGVTIMQDAECEEPDPLAGPATECRRVGTGDTFAIRWRNMQIAMAEVSQNPTLGFGTDSYRFEHVEPSCGCPAFINNLTVAVLYESGAIGVVALAGFVGFVLLTAWRYRAWAYLAAVVAMVVGYQFTDAIRFESNWILMGVVLGLLGTPALAGNHDPAETG